MAIAHAGRRDFLDPFSQLSLPGFLGGVGLGCHFAENASCEPLFLRRLSNALRPHRIYMNVLAVVVPELKFRDVQQARGMTSPTPRSDLKRAKAIVGALKTLG
jgi:hypothetical protein